MYELIDANVIKMKTMKIIFVSLVPNVSVVNVRVHKNLVYVHLNEPPKWGVHME